MLKYTFKTFFKIIYKNILIFLITLTVGISAAFFISKDEDQHEVIVLVKPIPDLTNVTFVQTQTFIKEVFVDTTKAFYRDYADREESVLKKFIKDNTEFYDEKTIDEYFKISDIYFDIDKSEFMTYNLIMKDLDKAHKFNDIIFNAIKNNLKQNYTKSAKKKTYYVESIIEERAKRLDMMLKGIQTIPNDFGGVLQWDNYLEDVEIENLFIINDFNITFDEIFFYKEKDRTIRFTQSFKILFIFVSVLIAIMITFLFDSSNINKKFYSQKKK